MEVVIKIKFVLRAIFKLVSCKLKEYFTKNTTYVHKTRLGLLKGKIIQSLYGQPYYSFESIPYAKPPIGPLRFKAPQPYGSWSGTLEATKDMPLSLQYGIFTQGQEDCLYLSVYSKDLSPSEAPRPVIFHIHGGGLVSGLSSRAVAAPDNLLQENVVFVGIHYRLGVLGFMNFKQVELDVPGNAGFKDIVLALKWVQDNISDYGGDPGNVTVIGESAGSVSAHLLTLSPAAKGLFHRVKAQSGSALNGWSKADVNLAEKLAKATGCKSTNPEQMLKHLQSISAKDIMKGQRKLHETELFASCDRYAGWVVEPEHPGAFLTENPLELLKKGDFNKVPVLFSVNSNEGLIFELLVENYKKKRYLDDPEDHVPSILNLERGSKESKDLGRKIVQFYTKDPEQTKSQHIYKLMGDTGFVIGVLQAAKLHSKFAQTFMYQFDYIGRFNILKILTNYKEAGAAHCDEMFYTYDNIIDGRPAVNSKEEIVQRQLRKMLMNFIEFDSPFPKADSLLPVELRAVNKEGLWCLNFGDGLEVIREPYREEMAFWDKVFNL